MLTTGTNSWLLIETGQSTVYVMQNVASIFYPAIKVVSLKNNINNLYVTSFLPII